MVSLYLTQIKTFYSTHFTLAISVKLQAIGIYFTKMPPLAKSKSIRKLCLVKIISSALRHTIKQTKDRGSTCHFQGVKS